jgi:hypothetical protein
MSTTSLTQISQLIHNFNWHSPSWDLFILLAWAIVSVFYAFAAGRGRIISLLMSLYISKLLVLQAPWLTNALNGKLPGVLSSLQQLISFLLIFLILFMLLGRYAFRTSADGRHFGSLLFGVIFAVLQIGLLISTILGYLSSGIVNNFSPLIHLLFLNNVATFVWLFAPLAFLVVLGRSIADPTEV